MPGGAPKAEFTENGGILAILDFLLKKCGNAKFIENYDFKEFCIQKHQYSITPIAISGKAEFSRKNKKSAENMEINKKVDFM